jgi:acyl dehydratase
VPMSWPQFFASEMCQEVTLDALRIHGCYGYTTEFNSECISEESKMQFGRCFEEFEIGDVYKHWPGRTITEYDDTLFSMLTMNHNPLHIDAFYSETTQHKQRLVLGPLIFSIALGMSVPDVSGKAIANLEFENVKHLAPTFHGDTIYAETRVLEKKLSSSKPDRGIITVETIAYNQRGENVLSFKRRVMVPTKEYDEARQREWDEKMAKRRKRHEGGIEL